MSDERPGAALRRDAARNREAILGAARTMADDGRPLQLNAVAREAGVGVGTVYRHFPTTDDLLETLVANRFMTMAAEARAAAASADPPRALRRFLRSALAAYVEDELFATAAGSSTPARDETARLRSALVQDVGALLDTVRGGGAIRASLSAADALALLCGIAQAVGFSPAAARRDASERYLDVLLDGMLMP